VLHRIMSVLFMVFAIPSGGHAQERIVNIYGLNEYIDSRVLDEFTASTGIRVVYDIYDSDENAEAKLLAGRSGYDIVLSSGSSLSRLIKAGVLHKLERERLKNLGNVWPDIAQRLAAYDPGNLFAVNYLWGTTGIGVNIRKVRERLGDIRLNTWDLIMKPEIAAKLRDCGVHVFDMPEDLFPIILNYLKMNPDSKSETDLRKAGDALFRIRGNIQKFHSSDYVNALAIGDICFVVGSSSEVLQAKKRAEEAKNGIEIIYLIPKEGSQIRLDSLAIPSDAKNKPEAYAFIDFVLKAETAAAITNFAGNANGNRAAHMMIRAEILGTPGIYPGEVSFSKLFATAGYDEKSKQLISRLWARIKTGRQ
jgi:putrescine transport system substrate-binding protein